MPVQIDYSHGHDLPASVAQQCIQLCNKDSESRKFFTRLADGDGATDEDLDVIVTYATIRDSISWDNMTVIGWATASTWNGRIQLQTFVDQEHREKGIGFSLIACLTFDMPKVEVPVAVFSDACLRIADRLGLNAEQWERKDNEWCLSPKTQG